MHFFPLVTLFPFELHLLQIDEVVLFIYRMILKSILYIYVVNRHKTNLTHLFVKGIGIMSF